MLKRAGKLRTRHIKLTDDQLKAEWKAVDRLRSTGRKRLKRVLRSYFAVQELEIMAAIAPTKMHNPLVEAFDLGQWIELLLERLGPEIRRLFERGLKAGFARVGQVDLTNDFTTDAVIAVITETIAKSELINQTTIGKLQEAVLAVQENSEDIEALRVRFREIFSEAKTSRADLIAETVATAAFEAGQEEAFQEAGIQKTRWLSQRNGRVRWGMMKPMAKNNQGVSLSR